MKGLRLWGAVSVAVVLSPALFAATSPSAHAPAAPGASAAPTTATPPAVSTSPAQAWVVDMDNSHVGFTGTQGTTPFEGGFKKFQITINMDPDAPETGKIRAVIDMASATAGSSERDSSLPQADWFDTGRFPQAKFSSTKIHALPVDPATPDVRRYLADGTLEIKGVVRFITLPFSLTKEGDHMRAKGKVGLLRTDFGIGKGQWANETYVKFGVAVILDISAKPAN